MNASFASNAAAISRLSSPFSQEFAICFMELTFDSMYSGCALSDDFVAVRLIANLAASAGVAPSTNACCMHSRRATSTVVYRRCRPARCSLGPIPYRRSQVRSVDDATPRRLASDDTEIFRPAEVAASSNPSLADGPDDADPSCQEDVGTHLWSREFDAFSTRRARTRMFRSKCRAS